MYQPPYTFFFFFNDTATTEIYTLSLHDALPISWPSAPTGREPDRTPVRPRAAGLARPRARRPRWRAVARRRSLAAPGRHVAAAAPAWRHWLHGDRKSVV